MKGVSFKFGIILVINILGLTAIYLSLKHTPIPVMYMKTVRMAPDIANADRLQVVFDRELIKDTQVGRTLSHSLYALKPAWPGTWTWSAPDTLEYLLNKPLPPGRVFTLSATKELEQNTGRVLKGKEQFTLHTPSLEFIKWSVVAADQRDVTMRVVFNQPVAPDSLLEHASFNDSENSRRLKRIQCVTRQPEKELVVRFAYPSSGKVQLQIKKELAGHQAELGLTTDVVREKEIKLAFAVTDIDVERLEPDRPVQIDLCFSDVLDKDQIIKGVTVEPPVSNLSISQYWRYMSLTGDFKAGRPYRVSVPATVLSKDGRTLGKRSELSIDIPDYRSQIAFKHSKGLLSPTGQLALEMRAVNLETMKINLHKVLENNLVHHLHGNDIDTVSRSAADKLLSPNLTHNTPQDVLLDLKGLITGPGIYRIDACDANSRWRRAHTLVAVSDLAMTSKIEKHGIFVWVTSIRTGKPLGEVTVKAFTYNNQLLAAAQTDAHGMASLRFNDHDRDGSAWVVTAQKQDNLTYLQSDKWQWTIEDISASSRPWARNYEALLYTERALYRPGETVHLTGIVREANGGTPPTFPLTMKVFRPDGVKVLDLPIQPKPDNQGMVHADFQTPVEGFTGQYRFVLDIAGDDQTLGSTTAQVEAFLPVRMEVQAHPNASWLGPNDLPQLTVSARYLWDQPGAKLPVSYSGWVKGLTFKSKHHPTFQFGRAHQQTKTLPMAKAQLDETGRSTLPITLPTPLQPGLYTLHLSATVTEPGGRSVSDNTSTVLDQTNLHIGLRLAQGNLVQTNQDVPVDWVRLTGKDTPAEPGAMTVRLQRIEYETVFKSVNNRRIWQTVEKQIHDVNAFTLDPDTSNRRFVLNCPQSGHYRLQVRDRGTTAATVLEFDASAALATDWTAPTQRPEQVTITTDRKRYQPGSTAHLRIQTPITGTLLLTLETDQVLYRKAVEITHKSMQLDIPFPETLRGSCFIVASVVREVHPDAADWLPHRAMGTLQVAIDHSAQKLPIDLTIASHAQPGEQVACAVKTGKQIDPNHPPYVHLWAVDEGILLAANYQIPDPFEFFLGPRTLGVQTADSFFQLLPDYQRPASMDRIGADEFMTAVGKRRSPVPMRRRQAALIWQKAIPLDATGEARFDLTMPELIGQMRVMAVLVDRDHYGHAQQPVTLTQALMVEVNWPRFATPGDSFLVPAKLFCTAEEPTEVSLNIECEGPLDLKRTGDQGPITLTPQHPTTLWLRAKATGLGPVEARISLESTDPNASLNAHAHGGLTVRPATTLHSETVLQKIPIGNTPYTYSIDPDFIPETTHTTVSVSGLPSVQLKGALQDLMRYPYGCVEQTSSQLRSLLWARTILDPDQTELIDAMVKAGIARLWGMQTRSGGLSYWPGSTEDNLWGTAYAASCLLEARDAGYQVEKALTRSIANYLDRQLRSRDNDNMDIHTKALICRVLARFGQVPLGWMTRLAEQRDTLDLGARAHLAAAFYATGRKDKALGLLPDHLSTTQIKTSTTGRLTSQMAQESTLLGILLQVKPDHPLVPSLVMRLEKTRSNGGWQSTLNNAGCISALCQYQANQPKRVQDFQGTIQAHGQTPVPFTHRQNRSTTVNGWSGPIGIDAQGIGPLYVTITTEGQSNGEIAPYAQGLKVERLWTDQAGQTIDPNQLTVGDLVQVQVSIQSTNRSTLHNIAIVDTLCAGLEVENPSLATSANGSLRQRNTPDRTEFLDDRVLLFCSANAKPRTFSYSLRVTTVGDFVLPPIQASCMYDPQLACLGAKGRVTVTDPSQEAQEE